MDFKTWKAEVNRIIDSYCGLTADDLADQPFRDWYNDGTTPSEAAILTLEDEGFPFDD